MAERSLTNELDLSGFRLIPAFTTVGGQREVTINANGSVTPVIDPAHVINFLPGGFPTNGPASSAGGNLEFIHSGTRLTYEDEYVFGAEHQFSHGVVVTARYMHRSLRRIVEDTGGIAPEAAEGGVTQLFSITNPSKNLDIFTNPIQTDFVATTDASGKVNNAPKSCDPGLVAFPITNSFGAPITDSQGNTAACFADNGVNGQPAGSVISDGIPDGFTDPIHRYWAVEFEANKSFSHNWQLRANYRIAKLFGNFEGAFRNDNGQSDRGISSLFDFTTGQFGQLGDQFLPGVLNTDRQQVANGYFTYIFDRGALKNLTLGTGIRIQTGTPINELAAHPVYLNAGEVPIGGRGSEGRTPTTGSVDLHAEYALNIGERAHLRFGVDMFNIANTKRIEFINQNIDLGFGTTNLDFLKPTNEAVRGDGIQSPFNARLFARFEF